jgi:hypothetical protein
MQGYVARLGLGITLIKNQAAEEMPRKKKMNFDLLMDLRKAKYFIVVISYEL